MGQFIFGLLAGVIVGLVMEWVIDWTGLLPKRSERTPKPKHDAATIKRRHEPPPVTDSNVAHTDTNGE